MHWPEELPASLASFCTGLGLHAKYTRSSLFIAEITEQQFLALYQFIAASAQLPCKIDYSQPSLEQFYLKMTGGVL